MRNNYEQLYGNKIEEMDKFLEKFSLPRLNQEEIEIKNNQITSCDQKSPQKQKPRTRWLHRRIPSNI